MEAQREIKGAVATSVQPAMAKLSRLSRAGTVRGRKLQWPQWTYLGGAVVADAAVAIGDKAGRGTLHRRQRTSHSWRVA